LVQNFDTFSREEKIMRRYTWIVTVAAALALTTIGCSKKEEAPPAPAQAPAPAPAPVAEAEKAPAAIGAEVYQASCATCHAEGVAGAPKTGDKAFWEGKIAGGPEQLVQNAINGIGTMPAKGGNPNLSDDEVRAAVEYMIEQSR
jgi:cytochrome c5